jgi:hypothetical protein
MRNIGLERSVPRSMLAPGRVRQGIRDAPIGSTRSTDESATKTLEKLLEDQEPCGVRRYAGSGEADDVGKGSGKPASLSSES